MGRRQGRRRSVEWNGIKISGTKPTDTLLDLYYIHAPQELSDDECTLLRIVGRVSLENVDTAQQNLNLGFGLAIVELDELAASVSDLDPIGSNFEDFARKNWLFKWRASFNDSTTSNNYWREIPFDVRGKRKLTATSAIVAAFRGGTANDWRYEGDIRALFMMT